MKTQEKKRISKLMSLVLRHQPEVIEVVLDDKGWLSVDQLIEGINRQGLAIDKDALVEIVRSNDKQRFVFNADQTKIRANQGHSINVDLDLVSLQPPEYLYHGTVSKFIDAIKTEGLQKMSRNHVHLSEEKETALTVGGRRGKPIVLIIKSGQMFKDGQVFYQSKNSVWLTDHVEPKYIEFK